MAEDRKETQSYNKSLLTAAAAAAAMAAKQ